MSKVRFVAEIQRPLSSSETGGLQTSTTLTLGNINRTTTFTDSGSGTGDRETPKQGFRLYDNETGSQTLDLSAFPNGTGGTTDFDSLRFLAIYNKGTVSSHTISVGSAGSNPFIGGVLEDATDIKVIQPGGTLIIVDKPLGAGQAVSTSVNLLMSAAASTSWEVVALGY